jgi:hypothetical protein
MGALNLSTTATLGTMLSSQAQPGAASVVSAAGGGAGGLFGGVLSAAGNILSSGAKTAQELAPAAASIYSSVQAYRLKEKELDLANKLAGFNQNLGAPGTAETPVVVSGGGAPAAAPVSQAGFGSMGLVVVGLIAVILLSRK